MWISFGGSELSKCSHNYRYKLYVSCLLGVYSICHARPCNSCDKLHTHLIGIIHIALPILYTYHFEVIILLKIKCDFHTKIGIYEMPATVSTPCKFGACTSIKVKLTMKTNIIPFMRSCNLRLAVETIC